MPPIVIPHDPHATDHDILGIFVREATRQCLTAKVAYGTLPNPDTYRTWEEAHRLAVCAEAELLGW